MAQSSPYDFDVYQPRNSKASAYYKCVENHFEELEGYASPGNVRELRNLIERAIIVSTGKTLEVHPPAETATLPLEHQNLEEVERGHIVSVLQQTGWRLAGPGAAAGILGLKRTTLQSKMKKLGIQCSRNDT